MVRPRLGELLLLRGLCTREQLLEAWEQKVLFGDRLGTNLLALGHINEEALSKALGEQLGVHSGHGGVIRVDKDAIKLIPRATAEQRNVVPHHVVGRQLFLLMKDPLDANAIDDVQFASGLHVVPVAVIEARMWQLLETHYGVRGSLRPVTFAPAKRPTAAAAAGERAALGPELTSEEDFQRLYAGALTTPAANESLEPGAVGDLDDATDLYSPSPPASSTGFLHPPKSGADASVRDWRDRIEATDPNASLPVPRTAIDDGFPLLELNSADALPPFPERQQTLDFVVGDVGDVVEEGPLTFSEATQLLRVAPDRDAIVRIVLRAARSTFKRACVLSVFSDRFVGWIGIGAGMEQDRIKTVVVPRNDKSVFGLVAETRSHYIGPLQKWPLHGPWVKQTGKKIPSSLAVVPILVRGRAVNLLVVDNGHGEHVGSELGELLILAQQIAITYETLLKAA